MALESVGYYALPIIPTFKGIERGISTKIKTTFGQTGTQAGKLMGDNVAKGLESAKGRTDAAAAKHARSLDKMKDAAGKTRVEIQKLNETINAGASGSRLEAQTERVAAALRKEAAAAREAKTAQTQLQNARRTQQGVASQLGQVNPLANVEQSMQSSSGGLSAAAAGLGTKVGSAFMGALGAVAGVAAVGALFKSAIDTGLDFERTVNAFSGVTNSGVEGMNRMREAARALGTDTKLAGVGARDAGNAMLELAKGGMTAQQAMEAARGTLQLSVAGQLDAAEAAKIQSGALNTFSLDASKATHVADLLAGAANGSSADVHDLGLALQQAGPVAAGFGNSIEDTLTALTMFSRMGINGSDAGTMLKTSMQAITDQGNPAQGAIEALGLTLYDQNKNFVGIKSMMEQVADASKRMSQEEFQAQTNILFGSDAMRASMVAAKGGAQAWDEAAAAVNRQGAAAQMAGAQMQGLPGVVESLSNVWEGFKLKLFDVIDGPLIAIGNWFTDVLSGGGPQGMRDFLSAIGDAMRSVGSVIGQYLMPALRQLWDNLKGPLLQYGKQWVETFKSAMPVMKAVGAVIGVALLAAIKGLSITLPMLVRGMTAVITVAKGIYTVFGTVIGALQPVASFLGGVFVGAWNLLKGAIGVAWAVIKPVFDGIKGALEFLGQAASYAFDTVIIPMWHNFQTVAGAAWSVVSPIFDGLKMAWGAVAGAALEFWHGTIEPLWEGVKLAFSAGWAAIQPIFENIKGAFQGVKDFVSGVWSGLAGVVKGAFDAIINAVKGPLRWIGGLLQKVPTSVGPIEIPGAQAAQDLGNTLAGLRSGTDKRGVLFGPGNGTSDSILGVDAKTGRATAFVSAGEGVVRADAMKRGGGKLVAALNAGWTPSADYLHSMVPGMKTGGVITPEEQSRMGGGTINASILSALRAMVPGAKLTSAKTDHEDDGGFHPKGMAIDVDPSSANLDALWKMRDKLTQIIFDDPQRVWYNVGGQRAEGAAARAIYGESTMSQHRDHIHVAAASMVAAPGGRRGRGVRSSSTLGTLSASSSTRDVAAAIISEAQQRGFSPEQTQAILATALQESGLNPKAMGGGGAWHGIFQQDQSYPGRDDPNKNIGEFFNRLGAPSGDIWRQIFTLQQGSPPETGRSGYMSEIQSQQPQAASLYNELAPTLGTGTSSSSTFLGYEPADPKKIREAEDRLSDRERDVVEKQALVDERQRKLDAAKPAQRDAAQRQLDNAKADLERATRERDEAQSDLEEVKQGTPKYGTDNTDGTDSTSLGGTKDTAENKLSGIGSIFKQFLSDTFGFGDLLPDPAELGIVKLASAIMGIGYTPQGKGFPWETGYAGGTGEPWSGDPFAGLQSDIAGSAGLPLGMIPGVNIPPPPGPEAPGGPAPHEGTGTPPGPVDASTNITINSPQGDPKDIEQRTRRTLLNTPRLNTYAAPGPAGQ